MQIYIVIVSACVCEHACMDVSVWGGGGGADLCILILCVLMSVVFEYEM